jgi:hypothetical protein
MLLPILRVFPIVLACSLSAYAQDKIANAVVYSVDSNISYRDEAVQDSYMRERCKLDVYYPVGQKKFSTVVWFHGGGLTGGEKSFPEGLKNQGIAIIAVNYRLSPQAKAPAYIEDAAAAVAWAFRNIDKYGGVADRIFVSGHSAGGYLTTMIGLDKQWLAKYDIDANRIAGLVPFSGQAITHFTIREERGIDRKQPVIDEFAPLFHVRKDASPMWIISGDRNLELIGRYEENAYFWRMMKEVGNTTTTLHELGGFNHGDMANPAFPLLLRFIKER